MKYGIMAQKSESLKIRLDLIRTQQNFITKKSEIFPDRNIGLVYFHVASQAVFVPLGSSTVPVSSFLCITSTVFAHPIVNLTLTTILRSFHGLLSWVSVQEQICSKGYNFSLRFKKYRSSGQADLFRTWSRLIIMLLCSMFCQI